MEVRKRAPYRPKDKVTGLAASSDLFKAVECARYLMADGKSKEAASIMAAGRSGFKPSTIRKQLDKYGQQAAEAAL